MVRILSLFTAITSICPWLILLFESVSQPIDAYSVESIYEVARNTRIIHGHAAAQPLYQEILAKNPQDMTAGTRIAASHVTPALQDKACPWISTENENDLNQFKHILNACKYDNKHVQEMCGIHAGKLGFDSQGPLFLRPIPPGSSFIPPTFQFQNQNREHNNMEDSSRICLMTLFLLGFAVPRCILAENIIGGDETIHLMEKLGLAFALNEQSTVDWDDQYIVPYVHIFPLDVYIVQSETNATKEVRTLRLVTDLHPIILSQTTIGENGDGAVMYIGPDSLALVQHLPLKVHVNFLHQKNKVKTSQLDILDLCSGSGIQALATLVALDECFPQSKAVCLDINRRALRFSRFNAMLNDIDPNRLELLNIDIVDITSSSESQNRFSISTFNNRRFDIICSNPPFIPVPQSSSTDMGADIVSIIKKKYGLFSSGGASGDVILGMVINISSQLLKNDGGLLAIVSEFMNPSMAPLDADNYDSSEIVSRIKGWWDSSGTACHGILFTNQYPLNADEYSRRRASNEAEYMSWCNNLENLKIKRVSPGLLFLLTKKLSQPRVCLETKIVTKTKMGSIWTPHNKLAVIFTRECWTQLCGAK